MTPHSFQIYPLPIPDLSAESPLIVYGRYQGKLPDSVKARGILADLNDIVIDLQVQITKDIPLERVRLQLSSLITFLSI